MPVRKHRGDEIVRVFVLCLHVISDGIPQVFRGHSRELSKSVEKNLGVYNIYILYVC